MSLNVVFKIDKEKPLYYFVGNQEGHWRFPNGYFFYCSCSDILRIKNIKWIIKGAISTGKYIYWPYIKVGRNYTSLQYFNGKPEQAPKWTA